MPKVSVWEADNSDSCWGKGTGWVLKMGAVSLPSVDQLIQPAFTRSLARALLALGRNNESSEAGL